MAVVVCLFSAKPLMHQNPILIPKILNFKQITDAKTNQAPIFGHYHHQYLAHNIQSALKYVMEPLFSGRNIHALKIVRANKCLH